MKKFFKSILLWLAVSHGLDANLAFSQSADEVALRQLQNFLFDATQRREFANQSAAGQQANNFLEKFPPWAQQELLEIVMEIMRQEGMQAAQYGQAAATQGAEPAGRKFSPALKARIARLAAKLQSDPQFSNPKNMNGMRKEMPYK